MEWGGEAIFPLGELIRHSGFDISRCRVLRSHFVPNGPEIGEDRLEERLFQKWHPRRSASAVFCADRSLDQFHVPIAPFLQSLVKIRHQFEQDRDLWGALVEP